jgi:hypothetical protein
MNHAHSVRRRGEKKNCVPGMKFIMKKDSDSQRTSYGPDAHAFRLTRSSCSLARWDARASSAQCMVLCRRPSINILYIVRQSHKDMWRGLKTAVVSGHMCLSPPWNGCRAAGLPSIGTPPTCIGSDGTCRCSMSLSADMFSRGKEPPGGG